MTMADVTSLNFSMDDPLDLMDDEKQHQNERNRRLSDDLDSDEKTSSGYANSSGLIYDQKPSGAKPQMTWASKDSEVVVDQENADDKDEIYKEAQPSLFTESEGAKKSQTVLPLQKPLQNLSLNKVNLNMNVNPFAVFDKMKGQIAQTVSVKVEQERKKERIKKTSEAENWALELQNNHEYISRRNKKYEDMNSTDEEDDHHHHHDENGNEKA